MKTGLYVIYDTATTSYNKPFHQLTEAEAIRTCRQIVNDPSQQPSHNPNDYVLFSIGQYDDSNAEIETWPPVKVVSLHELVRPTTYQGINMPRDEE